DWQTALVPVYLKTIYQYEPFFSKTKVLFSIHNLAYQGTFSKEEFPKTGLDWSLFSIDHFEFYGKANLMKAGIIYSDAINTVSPTYAKEILTKEFGCGLEGVLRTRKEALFGILNGIDYSVWNPQVDEKIFKKYSPSNIEDKYVNKELLQKEAGLKPDRSIPLFGLISRLADQKGVDLLAKKIDNLLSLKTQLLLLGTGENKYHILFERIAKSHPQSASINLKFDAVLAQKIYAGCDMFLIPSRYEPCCLSQMISFKYGTIPIVRQTGGLKDSVKEFDPRTGRGNGFTFVEPAPEEFFKAIKKALSVYKDKKLWMKLVKSVTGLDFSWESSAKEYIKLYNKIIGE
ncbi:MAG: glycogen synthase, partial [Candidatus Omnitrophica bacterium]|nr:glycogen synthase [Candidatus Omnitrophota bacterium]